MNPKQGWRLLLQATTLVVGFWHIWEARNEARNSEKPNPQDMWKILA
jgi:hypothetical protein